MDGLTQTCAALRRRIAELESDNTLLRRANKASAAAAAYPAQGSSTIHRATTVPGASSTLPAGAPPRQQTQNRRRNSVSVRGKDSDDMNDNANKRGSVLPMVGGTASDQGSSARGVGIDAVDSDEGEDGQERMGSGGLCTVPVGHDKQQQRHQRHPNSGPITRRSGSVLPSSKLEYDDRMSLLSPSAAGSTDEGGGFVAGRGSIGVKGREAGSGDVSEWASGDQDGSFRGAIPSPKWGSSRDSLSARVEDLAATRRVCGFARAIAVGSLSSRCWRCLTVGDVPSGVQHSTVSAVKPEALSKLE